MNEVEELQGLESACRLCLTTDETRSSIFGAAYNVDPLIVKIKNCLSLQISQEDKLSTLICITCVNKVNQWHQYKKDCLQSQDKLLEWLEKQSEPLPIVTVKKEVVEDSAESEEVEKISETQLTNSKEIAPEINENTEKNSEAQTNSRENPIDENNEGNLQKNDETILQKNAEKNSETVEKITTNLEKKNSENAEKSSECTEKSVQNGEKSGENGEDTESGESSESKESRENMEKTGANAEKMDENAEKMDKIESMRKLMLREKEPKEDEKQMEIETEKRERNKRRLSNDLENDSVKRFNPLPIKTEPIDDTEMALDDDASNSTIGIPLEAQQIKVLNKGKKKIRRGPHTHFRGARIFKRKCLHCQINLHSKTSYAKHMARFHSKVHQKTGGMVETGIETGIGTGMGRGMRNRVNSEIEETEELIEDVEEELENLEEDAPLTPVQQNIISQLKTYTCYSCEQSFQDRRSTLNHIRQHMPDLRTFTCVACLTEFGDQGTYKEHCEESFECAMKIALVIPIQGTEKYFTCNMCLLPMANRKELLSHLAKHSDKQYEELMAPPPKLTPIVTVNSLPYGMGDPAYNHECDLCGMIYRYKPNMIKHRELCASLQPEGRTSYKCIDCGMTFLVFNKFHNHVVTEHKKKELKCPKCAAKFRSPSDYLTHHEFHRKKNNLKDPQIWKIENEDKKVACTLCNQLIPKADLAEHRNLHLKVKIYSCVICRSMFSSPGALEIHMKDHGIDDPGERTANTSCMEYGQEETQSPIVKNTECAECGKNFSNVANLKRHIRNAHGEERRIDCPECNRNFKNKESFDEHQRLSHNTEKTVLNCPECPKTFVFQANLDLHIKNVHVHKETSSHECEICGKCFAEESSLKIHRGWHNRANSRFSLEGASLAGSSKPAKARKSFPTSQVIQLQCQVCDDKFHDVGDLRKHVWDVHCARTAKQEICSICSKTFPDQETLGIHMELHETKDDDVEDGENQFRCEFCDKYYSSRKILWRHKKLHKVSQVPSYQRFQSLPTRKTFCNGCNRTFSTENLLKRHKLTSTDCQFGRVQIEGKKPVTCHICKNVFPSMSILYQHKQLMHKFPSRERNNECVPIASDEGVKCNICGKLFSGVSNLKQHFAMKHKSVTMHPCNVGNCKMIFSTPHALKSHELQHSNMIFSCGMCEKHFFHRGIMEKHIYNAHRAAYESIVGDDKSSLFKETDLTSYIVKGATGTVCPRCKIKYPNIKAMKIHYFKFHETLG